MTDSPPAVESHPDTSVIARMMSICPFNSFPAHLIPGHSSVVDSLPNTHSSSPTKDEYEIDCAVTPPDLSAAYESDSWVTSDSDSECESTAGSNFSVQEQPTDAGTGTETTQAMVKEYEIVTVTDQGDMYLETWSRRYLVSSAILCIASPVFRAQLRRPGIGPGQHSHHPHLYVKRLPHDVDLIVLEIVLNSVHHQHRKVPTDVCFAELVELAVFADRYKLADALYTISESWMSGLKLLALGPGYEAWLFVAWVFEEVEVFEALSRKFIYEGEVDANGNLELRGWLVELGLLQPGRVLHPGLPVDVVGALYILPVKPTK